MKVARHEMPGELTPKGPVPEGRYELVARETFITEGRRTPGCPNHTVPSGRDRGGWSQAFHAWLPSFSPSGTMNRSSMAISIGHPSRHNE